MFGRQRRSSTGLPYQTQKSSGQGKGQNMHYTKSIYQQAENQRNRIQRNASSTRSSHERRYAQGYNHHQRNIHKSHEGDGILLRRWDTISRKLQIFKWCAVVCCRRSTLSGKSVPPSYSQRPWCACRNEEPYQRRFFRTYEFHDSSTKFPYIYIQKLGGSQPGKSLCPCNSQRIHEQERTVHA